MKKTISVLLILALCLCLLPVGVMAETEEKMPVFELYVGSVNALETPSGEGWSFDTETGVLTLDNCTLTETVLHTVAYEYGDGEVSYERRDTIIYFAGDLTIELIGDNSVERRVDSAPTDYTSYYAIFGATYEAVVDGENWDMPSGLTIRGSGNLTAGLVISEDCLDEEGYDAWEYLNYSCGIFCNTEGGVDLTGLQRGGWVDVYGGVENNPGYYWANAWNASPTFSGNSVVTAYQDVEGTMENEYGYNWNNNDAWRMKVVTADTDLREDGLLTLLDTGAASGEGWTWENNVLTLFEGTAVKAVEFRQNLGNAKLVLAGNVTLDSTDMGYDAEWNSIPCIGNYCDLEINAGAYTLTLAGESYSNTILSHNADVLISGGTLEDNAEYSYGIYISGGSLTIQDATLRSPRGIDINDGYDADWNTVPGGDILIQNASVTLDSPINSYGNIVTVRNSDLTVTWGYSCIYAPNGIYLQDSNITLNASGTALDTNEIVSIDNCNLNIISESEVISCGYVSYDEPDTEADFSKLSLTNMNITQPADYQIVAVEGNWGAKNVKLANADGTLATALIATAAEEIGGECSHSYGDWVITVPATLTSAGEQQKTCTLCGNAVTEEISCLAGDVEGWSLTLGGDLSVNFKLAIGQEIQDTAQVLITVAGHTVSYDAADIAGNADDNSVYVSASVSAAQMGETITVQIVNGEDASVTKTYSVLQYAQTILGDDSMSQYHSLVKEMLNYGAAAQVYFDCDTENLVNAGITGAGVNAVPTDAASEPEVDDQDSDISFYGASLLFRDKIGIRYYFTLSGDPEDYTFVANGTPCQAVQKGEYYYVEIMDINPQDLDDSLWVSAGDVTVSYCPMNYIVRMSQKGSANMQSLMKALYNYHLAAEALSPDTV